MTMKVTSVVFVLEKQLYLDRIGLIIPQPVDLARTELNKAIEQVVNRLYENHDVDFVRTLYIFFSRFFINQVECGSVTTKKPFD